MTKIFNYVNLLLVICLNVIPFFVVTNLTQKIEASIWTCLILQFVGSGIFMLQEFIQLRTLGFKYFGEVVNWVDILLHSMIFTFSYLLINYPELQFDPTNISTELDPSHKVLQQIFTVL